MMSRKVIHWKNVKVGAWLHRWYVDGFGEISSSVYRVFAKNNNKKKCLKVAINTENLVDWILNLISLRDQISHRFDRSERSETC